MTIYDLDNFNRDNYLTLDDTDADLMTDELVAELKNWTRALDDGWRFDRIPQSRIDKYTFITRDLLHERNALFGRDYIELSDVYTVAECLEMAADLAEVESWITGELDSDDIKAGDLDRIPIVIRALITAAQRNLGVK